MPLIYRYIGMGLIVLFFGTHVIYGYVKCVQSEWAMCPGQDVDHETEVEEDEEE